MSNPGFIHPDIKKQTKKTGTQVFPLTARELEIQMLLTTGMTNKMIARELGIYPCYLKLPVHSTPLFIQSCVAPLCRERPCASSCLALNKNERTLKNAFPSSTGICEGTVKIHVKNLMRKLNARSRLEVALMAFGMNLNSRSI